MELNHDDDNNDDDLIDIFLKKYGNNVDLEQISINIKIDSNLRNVYNGMTKFLEYDGSPWDKNNFTSIRSIKNYCQQSAKNMMIRSNAYSNLIKSNYPNHIRLSIHGHDNNLKFAVCLFKSFGLNYCITPWHNISCKMLDGRIILMKNIIVDKINKINQHRLKLRIDSKVSIYSRSNQMWFDDGIIDDIQYIDNSEWFIISYNNDKNFKRIQRFSHCLNPYALSPKINDEDNIHEIDLKHIKQYKKDALNFAKWSIGSKKMFKIVYKGNKRWYYYEV